MKIIDADKLLEDLMPVLIPKPQRGNGKSIRTVMAYILIKFIALQPEIEPPTTIWVGSYSPYHCMNCGKHVDSMTPYCPFCGHKAVNYINEDGRN